jgi:hypothetical protein
MVFAGSLALAAPPGFSAGPGPPSEPDIIAVLGLNLGREVEAWKIGGDTRRLKTVSKRLL